MTDTKQEFYPLNQSQIGLYYHCKEHPESLAYNLPSACVIPKDAVDIERLIVAIRKALNNHIAFRCKLVEQDGRPGWKLTDRQFDDYEIPVIELTDAEYLKEKEYYAKPFALDGELLFRVTLYKTETSVCILSDFHHLIYDGTSCSIWFQDIDAAYQGVDLEPEDMTMLEFCARDAEYLTSDAEMAARAYYRDVFAGAKPRTTLPVDIEESDVTGNGFMVYPFGKQINFGDVERVCNGRVGAFFIGAFAYAAAKFLGEDDAVVYTGNHGRNDMRLKHTAGMFVRMLPVYVKLHEGMKFEEYLAQVEDRLYGAIKKGKCSFGALMQEHGLSIDMSVLYQGDFFNHVPFGGMDCPWEALPLHGVDDDVCIMVFKEKEHFYLKVEYRKDKYKVETVQALLRKYEEVVAEFIGVRI